MTTKIKNMLLKKVSFVPGLVGLASIDFSNKAKMLQKDNLNDGMSFEDTPKGVLIRIAIIIDVNIRAKLVVREINSAVKTICKNNNKQLNKVLIYVMGVK